jgi:hypothetical protein
MEGGENGTTSIQYIIASGGYYEIDLERGGQR